MNTLNVQQFQKEHTQLHLLLRDYYTAAQIGKQMEDPSEYDCQFYENLMDSLQRRAAPLLGIEEEDASRDLECECGNTLAWLMKFFGPDYLPQHITQCGQCGQQTLHVSDESERCVNPACKYRSGIDAEGNVHVNGEIISNGGKSIDQLRDDYFIEEGLL